MGKKVKEYKSGDFIFAKVKGYPAWPARVQKPMGKKYFVYFYGTGETANLPPNMIFDYAENKDKFLTKTVKRRDFNDGVKQIEYDFANNVPLEQVIGVPMQDIPEAGDDTANDSAIDATMDDTTADTTANDTAANDTLADDTNATQNDGAVEDSDDAGALVIDEGKTPAKGKKSAKTPAKEAPKREPKTPRGKGKKDEGKEKEEEKTNDEELVSRSGRKIRPKRYMDEQTEENATLPSPAPKRRRGASPVVEKEKTDSGKNEKTFTQFNAVKQSELEGLKAPFKPVDEEKDNILIAYLPNGTYVGIKLFQSRPTVFKSEASRLQWDKQAAANAITLKLQLERNQITPESIQGQLVMDLNLTDEEKDTLDKERDTEEKKSRVHFLKNEMKLIELDAKIKTCLCLEKANTELCLQLLDELLTLDLKPTMLLKHPTCIETVKRMRAYVGNTPSWDLNESDALVFNKQAHKIRKKADMVYKSMKAHFHPPDGLSFWEYFSERVLIFKKVIADYTPGQLLELVHEPLELSQPNVHSLKSAIEEANKTVPPLPDDPDIEEIEKQLKKKSASSKAKKSPANSTPSKSKRSSRSNKKEEETQEPMEAQKTVEESPEAAEKGDEVVNNCEDVSDKEKRQEDVEMVSEESSKETLQEPENATSQDANVDVNMDEPEKPSENEETASNDTEEATEEVPKENDESEKSKDADKSKDAEKNTRESKSDKIKESDKPSKEEKSSRRDKKSKEDKSEQNSKDDQNDKSGKSNDKSVKDSDKSGRDSDKSTKVREKSPNKSTKEDRNTKDAEKSGKDRKNSKDTDKSSKDSSKNGKEDVKDDKSDHKVEGKDEKSDDKEKQESGETRAKRSRDSKKIEPLPSRSPAKRKSKF